MVLLEAWIDVQLVQQAAQHQARADQQNARQAHFRDHQRIAQPALPPAADGGAPALLQALFRIGAGGLPCGSHAEENARRHSHQDRESQHRRADVNILCAGKIRGQQRDERLHAAVGKHQPQPAAEK